MKPTLSVLSFSISGNWAYILLGMTKTSNLNNYSFRWHFHRSIVQSGALKYCSQLFQRLCLLTVATFHFTTSHFSTSQFFEMLKRGKDEIKNRSVCDISKQFLFIGSRDYKVNVLQ
jgi:hypothetical protein